MSEGAATPAEPQSKARIVYFDGARGFLLSMMYLAHFCFTIWSPLFYLHHGNYSAVFDAEFFVLISGFVCALSFLRSFETGGMAACGVAIANRLKWVYLYQVLISIIMLFLFRAFEPTPVHSSYRADFETPLAEQILAAVAMTELPPYLDILILYIVLMAFIPFAFYALTKGKVVSYFAVLIGLWLAANFGLDVQVDRFIHQNVFAYSDYVGLRGLFNPISYALVFFAGFYAGYVFKRGGEGLKTALLTPHFSLFLLSCAVIAIFAVAEVFRGPLGTPEPFYDPDRENITWNGLLSLASLSYAVFYLTAKATGASLLAPLGDAARYVLQFPIFVTLGRNSLFIYSLHLVAVFVACYALIATGGQTSFPTIVVGFAAGYAGLVGAAYLKSRYLPQLP